MKKSNFNVLIEKWMKGVRGAKGNGYLGVVSEDGKKFSIAITKDQKIIASAVDLNKKDLKLLAAHINEFITK